MFDRVDGFIRDYDGTEYLVLFGFEKYNVIYDRIRHLIRIKRWYYICFSHTYAKTKIGLDDD